MLAHIDYLEESIAELSMEIERMIAFFSEEVKLLDTIPGVDRRTAEVLIAEIGVDMSRFPTSGHLASWAEKMGISVWGLDQAGPFWTMPYPGTSWELQGKPACQPHQHLRNGTAKLVSLFYPATGEVRVKGVRSRTNAVLHPWLKEHLRDILKTLPPPQLLLSSEENQAMWKSWQEELTVKVRLPEDLPPLRMLVVLDNLTGHKSPELLLWMFARGIMVLYTPLGACWLNTTESMQRILKRRALGGHYPEGPEQIIEWLEAAARGWNRDPTPFKWGGHRAARRERVRLRRHALGGSGACTRRPIRRRHRTVLEKWQRANQLTH